MPNETGKGRQSSIEQNYFRRDPMVRRRSLLAVLAVVAAGGWWLLAPTWDRDRVSHVRFFQQDRLASPGPVARVHATWDAQCIACHVPFEGINHSRWSPLAWLSHRNPGPGGDSDCRKCHAGPIHHETQLDAETPACAECHRDHRGRDANLTQAADSTCTGCHANLAVHRKADTGIAAAVSRFDGNRNHHPEFAVISRQQRGEDGDPGHLKFNHALHLAPGLARVPDGRPIPLWTYERLAASQRPRFGWKERQPLSDPVQLDCASCHQLDSEEHSESAGKRKGTAYAPRGDGAIMLPVRYEVHCQACHPLNAIPDKIDREIPHGLTPPQVVERIREYYLGRAVGADRALLERILPGRRPLPGAEPEARTVQVRQAVEDKTLASLRILFGSGQKGCMECHQVSPEPLTLVTADDLNSVVVRPVNVPSVWFKHARFDHTAHRAVRCLECHGEATTATTSARVLLPGIENCVQCHGAESSAGSVQGAAASDCSECHRYHNGDHPLQGRGASARGVEADRRRMIEEFRVPSRTAPGS